MVLWTIAPLSVILHAVKFTSLFSKSWYTDWIVLHSCLCLQTYPGRVQSNDGVAIVCSTHIWYIQVEVTIMKTAIEETLKEINVCRHHNKSVPICEPHVHGVENMYTCTLWISYCNELTISTWNTRSPEHEQAHEERGWRKQCQFFQHLRALQCSASKKNR